MLINVALSKDRMRKSFDFPLSLVRSLAVSFFRCETIEMVMLQLPLIFEFELDFFSDKGPSILILFVKTKKQVSSLLTFVSYHFQWVQSFVSIFLAFLWSRPTINQEKERKKTVCEIIEDSIERREIYLSWFFIWLLSVTCYAVIYKALGDNPSVFPTDPGQKSCLWRSSLVNRINFPQFLLTIDCDEQFLVWICWCSFIFTK